MKTYNTYYDMTNTGRGLRRQHFVTYMGGFWGTKSAHWTGFTSTGSRTNASGQGINGGFYMTNTGNGGIAMNDKRMFDPKSCGFNTTVKNHIGGTAITYVGLAEDTGIEDDQILLEMGAATKFTLNIEGSQWARLNTSMPWHEQFVHAEGISNGVSCSLTLNGILEVTSAGATYQPQNKMQPIIRGRQATVTCQTTVASYEAFNI